MKESKTGQIVLSLTLFIYPHCGPARPPDLPPTVDRAMISADTHTVTSHIPWVVDETSALRPALNSTIAHHQVTVVICDTTWSRAAVGCGIGGEMPPSLTRSGDQDFRGHAPANQRAMVSSSMSHLVQRDRESTRSEYRAAVRTPHQRLLPMVGAKSSHISISRA